LRAEAGKTKWEVKPKEIDSSLLGDVKSLAGTKLKEIVYSVLKKEERSEKNNELLTEATTTLAEKYPEQEKTIAEILHDMEKELMRSRILQEGIRLDGRNTKQIRPISIELGILPRTHGSSLFTRGETQSLTAIHLELKTTNKSLMDYVKSTPRSLCFTIIFRHSVLEK
jgi:polyribonucleotide nucleotidyltransferase